VGGDVTQGRGLETDVQFLKGVGPKHALMLHKLGIKTVGDMLFTVPRRYEDRREIPPISYLRPGQSASVRGELVEVFTRPVRGGRVLLKATIQDETGRIALVWFNQPWVARQLEKVKGEIIAFGQIKEGDRMMEMHAPEWEALGEDDDPDDFARLVPVYALSEGVQQWVVRKAARSAVEYFSSFIVDPLPESLRRSERLPALAKCLEQIHVPESTEKRDKARERLVFEEFLYLQLMLQMRRMANVQEVGISFPISGAGAGSKEQGAGSTLFAAPARPIREELPAMFPFELTGAQKRVIEKIYADMERPAPMNRLVQGDVGSGKTAVAAAAMLACVRCGYQAALMAPTEILAEQHYINIHRMFDPLGIDTRLLVGKQTAAQKRKAVEAARAGQAQICIGTHALIQEGVAFSRLGLAIIDEQHRFGVEQRLKLRLKGYGNPDVLVMTATPIPRTLTMTMYGDLDVSVIDEMPPGRKPIKTHWKRPNERQGVYDAVRKLLLEGRQAYFVCPLISESDKMQTQAAEDLYYRLTKEVFPDYQVALLHGQLKSSEKEETMEAFRRGEIDVLVSTVVIEVGVDVPNASVMVIEDANRFGLAQLHQLRGRVGRGEHQSFCVLVADATTDEARQRLGILVETTDGFRIAEEDLKIRGPGDVAGTRQHGELDFKFANLVQDAVLLERARSCAIRVLEADPGLRKPENAKMLARVKEKRPEEALVSVS
jgi:ATP-dependent DNA helicase RecG